MFLCILFSLALKKTLPTWPGPIRILAGWDDVIMAGLNTELRKILRLNYLCQKFTEQYYLKLDYVKDFLINIFFLFLLIAGHNIKIWFSSILTSFKLRLKKIYNVKKRPLKFPKNTIHSSYIHGSQLAPSPLTSHSCPASL